MGGFDGRKGSWTIILIQNDFNLVLCLPFLGYEFHLIYFSQILLKTEHPLIVVMMVTSAIKDFKDINTRVIFLSIVFNRKPLLERKILEIYFLKEKYFPQKNMKFYSNARVLSVLYIEWK